MVGKLDGMLSMCPISQGPPGELDCVSASDLVHLLFAPHGVDNSGLTREAWTSPSSTCGCQKTDSMTKPSCAIDQKVAEPMDEGNDDSASTVGTPETLPSVKVSIEAPKSVLQH